MSLPIQVAIAPPLLTIRIARPEKKNSLTAAMYRTMVEALLTANADPAIKVIAILGEPGAFSAGNDIQEFLAVAMGGPMGADVLDFIKGLVTNAKPIVAAVDGFAVGVGTTMLLHCDYVVASTRASFSTPFTNLGLVPEAGSSLLGPRAMGHVLAFEMLAMGRTLSAERALAGGFINEIVPEGQADATALRVAAEIAAKPTEAMAAARRLLRGDTNLTLARLEEESRLFAERLRSDEAKQAFAGFLAKK